ncbi:MAG: M20/M25/M40 family metallo-hydrolase [Promethearchaeota archaeon]
MSIKPDSKKDNNNYNNKNNNEITLSEQDLKNNEVMDIFINIIAKTPRPSKKEEKIRDAITKWFHNLRKEFMAKVNKNNIKEVSVKDIEEIMAYLDENLKLNEDEVGNILIKIPATKGLHEVAPLIFQAHMDMVCETNLKEGYDFENKGINVVFKKIKGELWLTAQNTTLGADDGIGLALNMAIIQNLLSDPTPYFISQISETIPEGTWSNLEKNIERFKDYHGPLEFLFTIDEETDLTGARNLDATKLEITGKHLINVDSEEMGVITTGSAAGRSCTIKKKITESNSVNLLEQMKDKSEADSIFLVSIEISGLKGGHSGVDIHLFRGNANELMSRLLNSLLVSKEGKEDLIDLIDKNLINLNLVYWNGGSKSNAIARDAKAIIAVKVKEIISKYDKDKVKSILNKKLDNEMKLIMQYYKKAEPDLNIKINLIDVDANNTGENRHSDPRLKVFEEINNPEGICLNTQESIRLIRTLYLIPHGVLKYLENFIVETSNNFAIVNTFEENQNRFISVLLSSRSFYLSQLDWLANKFYAISKLIDADFILGQGYPAWVPDPQSKFLKFVEDNYQKVFSKFGFNDKIISQPIHAGLETAIFTSKIEGVQMVSIGPTIQSPHTHEEKLLLKSVPVLYDLLKLLILKFAKYNSS